MKRSDPRKKKTQTSKETSTAPMLRKGGKNLSMLKAAIHLPSPGPSNACSEEDDETPVDEEAMEDFIRQEQERRLKWSRVAARRRRGLEKNIRGCRTRITIIQRQEEALQRQKEALQRQMEVLVRNRESSVAELQQSEMCLNKLIEIGC
ncbi:uncharacterized protein LOC108909127 [Anoplophora glabripennis]|uniref:uncharacterized protein LOC108909127 n=1 Tax=Anoplophora glabripennis TaxID=217634 RepID=UPI000C76102A|nr:uncharacterized protein LOC108909127 [Anoplophora glabripennis]